jgi:hypothetical protein
MAVQLLSLPGGLITILITIPNNRQRVTDQPLSDELNSTVVLVVMASGCRECAVYELSRLA